MIGAAQQVFGVGARTDGGAGDGPHVPTPGLQ